MSLKFVVDMPLSSAIAVHLRSLGYDAVHLRELGRQRARDPEIVEFALHEQRVIVTADLDYGYLLVKSLGPAPSAILLRLEDYGPMIVSRLLVTHLPQILEPLTAGALVVIEEDDVRIRRLPSATDI